jgi:hemerythrin-like domain-containing protein
MQNRLFDILRLQREHGGILEAIGSSLDAVDELRVANTDKVREVVDRLNVLYGNLSNHVKFEEQEVLPKLAEYAAKIIAQGAVLEHEEILAAIWDLTERARYLAKGSIDENELDIFQADLRTRMQDIHSLVEDHAQKQEVILDLAERVIQRETR